MTTTTFARDAGFGRLVLLSALVGAFSAIGVLVFLGVESLMHTFIWGEEQTPLGWFSGSLTAVAIVVVASFLVGWLRKIWQLEGVDPNFVDEMIEGEVRPQHAARFAAIGMVSMIGGGSVGPEAPLGTLGAGIGTGVSEKVGGDQEMTKDLTFAGISSVFGGLATTPYAGPIMALEAHHERWAFSHKRLIPGLVAATVALTVLFPFAGSPFLNVYDLAEASLEVTWIPIAIGLGVLGAFMGIIAVLSLQLAGVVREKIKNSVVRSTVAGCVIAAVDLPCPSPCSAVGANWSRSWLKRPPLVWATWRLSLWRKPWSLRCR